MTFTNQIEINEKNICYYRKAYSIKVFEELSVNEKRSLIAFTVEEFTSDVNVVYSDELCNEIGVLTEQDVLLINNTMLLKSNKAYSLELYLFLYKTLLKRFAERKKNFVPVIKECYINKKWKNKNYQDYTFDVIIFHMLLNELLEMYEVVLDNDEERKYILGEIEKTSNRLLHVQDIVEPVRIEILQEQPEISETNDVHINRGR